MAVSSVTFLAEFPEFANVDSGVLSAELTAAEALCPSSVWGDFQEQGVKLTTASHLAQRPTARDMQLEADGTTVYDRRLETLKRVVTSGARVI